MSIKDADQAYLKLLDLLHTRSLEGWDTIEDTQSAELNRQKIGGEIPLLSKG